MGQNGRLAVRAVEETMDVRFASERVTQVTDAALADGRVEPHEAAAIRQAVAALNRETDEALQIVGWVELAERIASAGLTGVVPPYLLKLAREIGLPVVVVHPAVAEPVELFEDDRTAA